MNLNKRVELISEIGILFRNYLNNNINQNNKDSIFKLKTAINKTKKFNSWFTEENINFCLNHWSDILNKKSINKWISNYNIKENRPKNVAIIMAGNIPLVGFHDFICVFLSGNKSIIKLSSNDKYLIPFIIEYISSLDNNISKLLKINNSFLNNYDAVIATGSNNTSRYFEYYFKNCKSIIRKNRNSIAILSGNESKNELFELSKDIFTYFGLGCRSVSKLYVPVNYNFNLLFEALYDFKDLINNHKYINNYDYNKAVYLMSEYKFLDNGYFILRRANELNSPIATVNYETYKNIDKLKIKLSGMSNKIQCIVSNIKMDNVIKLGETQTPKLNQYADNLDVVDFLLTI